MPQSICYQYSIGNDTYIQYGCIILNETTHDWQKYVQRSLQQYYIENKMLKENEYVDILLYDSNVLIYDYKIELFSASNNYFDYNLYIDTLANTFTYNGIAHKLTQ